MLWNEVKCYHRESQLTATTMAFTGHTATSSYLLLNIHARYMFPSYESSFDADYQQASWFFFFFLYTYPQIMTPYNLARGPQFGNHWCSYMYLLKDNEEYLYLSIRLSIWLKIYLLTSVYRWIYNLYMQLSFCLNPSSYKL